jgi:hypothetical protein
MIPGRTLPKTVSPNTPDGSIDLAPAVQFCTRKAYRYRRLRTTSRVVVAAGSVVTLALLQFWNPASGASRLNMTIYYAISGIAFISSLTVALSALFGLSRNAAKYETATRAIRRLRDLYNAQMRATPPPGQPRVKALELWAKDHVYRIEALIDDSRILDVDLALTFRDPPP